MCTVAWSRIPNTEHLKLSRVLGDFIRFLTAFAHRMVGIYFYSKLIQQRNVAGGAAAHTALYNAIFMMNRFKVGAERGANQAGSQEGRLLGHRGFGREGRKGT